MSSTISTTNPATIADLIEQLGDIPTHRILLYPYPGTAREEDLLRVSRSNQKRICELIDGTLVEKAMGLRESFLASWLIYLLQAFVQPRNLGMVSGEQGILRLSANRVRIPDVAYFSWDRMPQGRIPEEPIPDLVPNLAIEILSESNTAAEMRHKREDYFQAGVELVWEVNPRSRTVDVFSDLETFTTLVETDQLSGGTVLVGLSISLETLFGELDRCKM